MTLTMLVFDEGLHSQICPALVSSSSTHDPSLSQDETRKDLYVKAKITLCNVLP